MSGIAGIYFPDGRPVEADRIRRMTDAQANRGPDAAGCWTGKHIGLGHRALWTTPEAKQERQPHQDAAASLVITFDGRIDNREELVRLLRSAGCPPREDTDVEIALRAYQCWGEASAERILGDFAFAIWDGTRNTLFCARDIFGTRPLYYHHRPGMAFSFASTPDALFAGGVVSRELNEARIADYLVSELEGIDKTSTFFKDVFRLPPAHTATVASGGMSIKRYWQPEPGPELRLASDREYEEAFLEPFTEAVRCRLRGGDRVSSMLSGGLDSSSIVGVARALRREAGGPPLRTYSVMSREPAACIETRAIQEMLKLDGLNPVTLSADQLPDLFPELTEQTWHLEEPFDYHMIVPRSLYILARRQGVRVMLDGIDGDSVLSEGMFLPRLVRRGKLITAWREAAGLRQAYLGGPPVGLEMINALRAAFVPDWLRMGLRPLRKKAAVEARAGRLVHRSGVRSPHPPSGAAGNPERDLSFTTTARPGIGCCRDDRPHFHRVRHRALRAGRRRQLAGIPAPVSGPPGGGVLHAPAGFPESPKRLAEKHPAACHGGLLAAGGLLAIREGASQRLPDRALREDALPGNQEGPPCGPRRPGAVRSS